VIPKAIQQRLAERRPARPRADRPIAAGDIRRAESGGEERLVLILKVNPKRENAQITLTHPYPEYATENDIIVDPALSGVTYPIIVQGGMRGLVWLKDLGRLVARVPDEVVSACLGARAGTPLGAGLSVGTTFLGALEARADFKQSERASLARLCEDCTAAALESGAFELDVDEVFSALLAPSPHAGLMMQSIVDLYKTRGDNLVFTLDHVEFLESKGLLVHDRWELALGVEGLAFRLGTLEKLIERARSWYGLDEPRPTSTLREKDLVAAVGSN